MNTAIVRSRSRYSSMSRLMNVGRRGRRRRRRQIERHQALDDLVDDLVERPHRDVARDRRHLDRDVVDVGSADRGSWMPSSRRSASSSPSTASPSRLRFRRRAALAESSRWRGRASRAGRRRRGGPTISRSTRRAIGTTGDGSTGATAPPTRTAPRRYQGRNSGTSGATRLEIGCRGRQALGTHDAVDEADRERQAVRVLQHPASRSAAGSTSASALSASQRLREGDRARVGEGRAAGAEGGTDARCRGMLTSMRHPFR